MTTTDNIRQARKEYKNLRETSYDIRYNNRPIWWDTKRRNPNIADHSASAKQTLISWGNAHESGITGLKKKIEKTKYMIDAYDKCLDKLFFYNTEIEKKDTDKKVAYKDKKLFKNTTLQFLLIIETWNAQHKNKVHHFMIPDITHASGRFKNREKIIAEFERNLRIEKSDLQYNFKLISNLLHIKKTIETIETKFLNAKYNPKTKLGYKFMNDLYDENF